MEDNQEANGLTQEEELVKRLVNTVVNSKYWRPFFGNCKMTAEEEYELANKAGGEFDKYLKEKTNLAEKFFMIKIGREIMFGCFLAARLDFAKLADKILQGVIEQYISLLQNNNRVDVKKLLNQQFLDYLEFCEEFGINKGTTTTA
jgi:hypothetical protein